MATTWQCDRAVHLIELADKVCPWKHLFRVPVRHVEVFCWLIANGISKRDPVLYDELKKVMIDINENTRKHFNDCR